MVPFGITAKLVSVAKEHGIKLLLLKKHIVGAGKGYKGGPKKTQDPPTPTPTPTDAAIASLATQTTDDADTGTDTLFFV
jgi:hypothetical protein